MRPDQPSAAPRHALSCPLRDEGEGEGEGEPAGREVRPDALWQCLKHLIPLAGAMLAIGSTYLAGRRSRYVCQFSLVLCAVLAVCHYTRLGNWPHQRYVNGWEFFHYYLGSKYLPELGYTGLYEAALIADVDTGRKFHHEKDAIRNLSTGGCLPVDKVLSQHETILDDFSKDRWSEFKTDVAYFKHVLTQFQWDRIFHDKGYNATPMWSMLISPLTNNVRTSQPAHLTVLALADPLLLAFAVIAVWRTFDSRSALLMIILIGTHMTTSHTHMKGALLRTDWVVTLVLAVCALKAQRPALAGALLAWAAASRVFPTFFAAGPLMLALVPPLCSTSRRYQYARFARSFCATLVVLVVAAWAVWGSQVWLEFIAKIWEHNDSFSPWRVGLKHLFLGAYKYQPDGAASHQEIFHQRWMLWWLLQGLLLIVVVGVIRDLDPWEGLACGFITTFFMVAPTYYYYIMLVIPLLFFCGRLERPERAAGLLWLLGSSSLAYAIHDAQGRTLLLFFVLSCLLLGVCLLMVLAAIAHAYQSSAPRLARHMQVSSPVIP